MKSENEKETKEVAECAKAESASEIRKSEEDTEGAKAEAAFENGKLEEEAERAKADSAYEIEKSGGGVLSAKVESTSEIRKSGEGSECVTAEGDVEGAVIGMERSESLDFDKFLHPSDMEVLGLERLKQELQKRGLKCGGSLAERAGRLFLLKTCALEKLDKKHFAKEKKP
ncbi:hypothetical protein KP509_21G080900 [Ceratopteris richardii]|nr:hypothetical protein KP509_21G080900 [Ceratopteris richardii]